MRSGNDEETKYISKGDITKTLDSAQVNYEYKEINLSKAKEVSDIIMDILVYSSKHSISGEETKDKEGGQANSCEIF